MTLLPCERCGRTRPRRGPCPSCGHASSPSTRGPSSTPVAPPRAELVSKKAERPRLAPPRLPVPRLRAPRPRVSLPIAGHGGKRAEPDVVGRVLDISPTPPQAGDRPWWSRAALLLAVVPGALAAASLLALRAVTRAILRTERSFLPKMLPFGGGDSHSKSSTRGLLAAGGAGVLLGWHLRGRHSRDDREHTMVRVHTGEGTKVCRIASQPGMIGISVGDQVELRGRFDGHGCLRAFAMRNQTTGADHRPRFVSPTVVALAFVSLVLVVLLFNTVDHLHAG
jgi:hypothetical protein